MLQALPGSVAAQRLPQAVFPVLRMDPPPCVPAQPKWHPEQIPLLPVPGHWLMEPPVQPTVQQSWLTVPVRSKTERLSCGMEDPG